MSIPRRDITIVSSNNPLKGWLYQPESTGDVPVVIMAHGFSAVKEMGLDNYADVFVNAGLAVVVFDHPCFGSSGGTPRFEVNPERQLRAYRDAITWAQGVDGIDPNRIGLWGTSFSGGHVIVLAAIDKRISAVVSQVPYLASPVSDIPDELATILLDDEAKVRKGEDPILIPVATREVDGPGALSPDPDAWRFFQSWADRAPTWRNQVTLKSLARLIAYRPLERACEVQVPVLVVAARDDILAPHALAVEAHAAMPDNCELLSINCGHFDIYESQFNLVSHAEAGWFTRWLSA